MNESMNNLSNNNQPINSKSKNKFGIIIGVSIVIIIAGVIGIKLMSNRNNSNTSNNTSNNENNLDSNNQNSENQQVYSTCAKSGNKCSEEDIYYGQLVNVQVNDSENYDFYVISDDGQTVTLLKNSRLGLPIEWLSIEDQKSVFTFNGSFSNDYGPYTVLKYLNELTTNWTNINAIDNYYFNNKNSEEDKSYKSLEIQGGKGTLTSYDSAKTTVPGLARARLLEKEEVEKIIEFIPESEVKQSKWIFEIISKESNGKENTNEYADYCFAWLLDADFMETAASLSKFGETNKLNIQDKLLLLPVISIDKTLIK